MLRWADCDLMKAIWVVDMVWALGMITVSVFCSYAKVLAYFLPAQTFATTLGRATRGDLPHEINLGPRLTTLLSAIVGEDAFRTVAPSGALAWTLTMCLCVLISRCALEGAHSGMKDG